MRSTRATSSGPCLWAIGGGKGGVGKTVVASSLAVAFARRGRRCVVVDADLGGANLHTVLGMGRPERTLSAFLRGEVRSLADVACPTRLPNLRIVSGAHALFDAANPRHAQKLKLLRHLHRLDADDVFVDLSAGSSFNVLDFFVEAERGVAVVTPEPTSIENAYQFLKAAWFRSLARAAHRPGVREPLRRVLARRSGRPQTPLALVAEVSQLDEAAGRALAECARSFVPQLLVNQATGREHRQLGAHLLDDCRASLGARLGDLGTLPYDDGVRAAVAQGRPVLEVFPRGAFAEELETLVDLLLPAPTSAPAPIFAAQLGDVSQPGALLRRRREQLGLALPSLERRTRIRALEWLESERFDQLPAEPYVRGFVVQYARELGLQEADALVESFLARFREARA